MKKNLNNNKKLNTIREFIEMLGFHLEDANTANDWQVIAAAEDAGFECVFTKTGFTVKNGKENFTIRFKNGMDPMELQARVTVLYLNTIKKLAK